MMKSCVYVDVTSFVECLALGVQTEVVWINNECCGEISCTGRRTNLLEKVEYVVSV